MGWFPRGKMLPVKFRNTQFHKMKRKATITDFFAKKKSENSQVQQGFSCHECGQLCANQGNLANHMKGKHPIAKDAGSILKYVQTVNQPPFWTVLRACIFGACWMANLLEPGKMNPVRTTFSKVVRTTKNQEAEKEKVDGRKNISKARIKFSEMEAELHLKFKTRRSQTPIHTLIFLHVF